MLSPDGPKLRSAIQLLEGKLRRHAFRLIFQHQQRLDFAARALVSPQERLEREREKLQRQQLRLVRAMNIQYGQRQLSFLNTKRHFNQSRPELQPYRRKFSEKTLALRRAVIAGFDQNRTALTHCSQALTLLNPHNVLTRGYAIVRVINKSANNGGAKFVTGIDMVHANDLIAIQLHDGDIQGVVSQSIPKTKSETGQEKSNVACDWPV